MNYLDKNWQRPTLPRITAVPLALMGLTSLFGMGRGGPHRYSHHKPCPDIYRQGLNLFDMNDPPSLKATVDRL